MTLPLVSQAVTKPAADPTLTDWRFLWAPLTSEAPARPPAAGATAWPLPAQPAAGATALAVIETMPQQVAQAALPAVLQAYRQNAD